MLEADTAGLQDVGQHTVHDLRGLGADSLGGVDILGVIQHRVAQVIFHFGIIVAGW